MKTLDRTKPFGTISPPHNGASFEQDGVMFDHEGKPVGAGSEPKGDGVGNPDATAPEEVIAETAEGGEADAVDENAQAEAAPDEGPIEPAGENPAIDWDDSWFKVRAVLKEHGFEGTKKAEGIAFARSNGWPVPE